jgi:hypothetical protein
VTVKTDCPWCSAPVALCDDDIAITCDACGVVADLAMAESARLADAA